MKKTFLLFGVICLIGVLSACKPSNSDPSDVDETKTVNVNVIYASASLPSIISSIEMCGDSETPTIYYQERSICNFEKLPSNVIAKGTITLGQTESLELAKKDVLAAKEKYKNVKFTLYVNDYWYGSTPLELFDKQGITDYKVYLVSDGTASFGDASILGRFDTKEEYDAIKLEDYYASGVVVSQNDALPYSRYNLKLAVEDEKFTWVVQYPDLLLEYISDADMKEIFENAIKSGAIKKYDILASYKALSETAKKQLRTTLNYDDYAQMLTPSQGKKGMMIVGGSDSGMGLGKYQPMITALIEKFGTENYDYYYKPHPAWPASKLSAYEGKTGSEFFEENNIVEIPAALPSDLTMVMYADTFDCGGYFGTTFVTVPSENVKFFFADKSVADSAARPLDKMFEKGMLDIDKIEWITLTE